MDVGRYRFNQIFDIGPGGILVYPKFDIDINGVVFRGGVAISRTTYLRGLDLFRYIGQDISGRWDPANQRMYILGFYV